MTQLNALDQGTRGLQRQRERGSRHEWRQRQTSTLYIFSGKSLNSFAESVEDAGILLGQRHPDDSVSSDTKGYYNNGGNGDGFSLPVLAGTTTRNFTVWVGGYGSNVTLYAAALH